MPPGYISGKLWRILPSPQFRNISTQPARRVVVTGLGAVTPLGDNVQSSWQKLIAGQGSITKLHGEKYRNLPCKVAATVDKQSLNLEKQFLKTELKTMGPATVLALLATKEALESAKLDTTKSEFKERIGVCVGMGMLDLDDVCNSYEALSKAYNRLSPYFIPRILPNMTAGHISIKYGFRGPNHSVSTACATGAHAIGDAYNFVKHGDADIIICGSSESCIDPLTVGGFCRLRALSTSFNDSPIKASRPFDKRRDGFVMGEGAAILVLEELNHAKSRKANIIAELLGYGLSGDATHLTAPSEDGAGAKLAMSRALKSAGIATTEISYINAHATSTPVGDKVEAKAIFSVFGDHAKNLLVSSTKGAHGHLLGASGSLESLFVALACKNQLIPPTINLENVEEDLKLNIATNSQQWQHTGRRIALKNSFGFGGTNACLCIAEYLE